MKEIRYNSKISSLGIKKNEIYLQDRKSWKGNSDGVGDGNRCTLLGLDILKLK